MWTHQVVVWYFANAAMVACECKVQKCPAPTSTAMNDFANSSFFEVCAWDLFKTLCAKMDYVDPPTLYLAF